MAEQVMNEEQVLNAIEQDLIYNAYMTRQSLISKYLDPRRDIYKECGHPSGEEITIEKYMELYEREPVAARVVEVLPEECWKTQPDIYETEDEEEVTKFEEAWNNLTIGEEDEEGSPEKSYYKKNKGSKIWSYLERADKAAGIGNFGAMVLGFDDLDPEQDLSEELTKGSATKLLYIRCLDQSRIEPASYETDKTSTRYGKPTSYNVKFNKPEDILESVATQDQKQVQIHWTRVIHIPSDYTLSNELFGFPRMLQVLNNLHNIQKISSGSGEMFWRGAFPGLSIETHPSMGGDAEIDAGAIRKNLENYMNGLKRYIALTGMTAKSLEPQAIDPGPHLEPQIELICIKLGVPKRIFMGSERGELASSQDDSTWNERLTKRQNRYVTPHIVVQFIDRLIYAGVLPEPADGYECKWPDLDALTDDEKAGIAIKKTHSLTKYVQGGVEMIMSPLDFYTKILSMDADEAQEIIDNAVDAFEANEDREFARQLRERELFGTDETDQNLQKGLQKSAKTVAGDAQSGLFTGVGDIEGEAESGLNDGLV